MEMPLKQGIDTGAFSRAHLLLGKMGEIHHGQCNISESQNRHKMGRF